MKPVWSLCLRYHLVLLVAFSLDALRVNITVTCHMGASISSLMTVSRGLYQG